MSDHLLQLVVPNSIPILLNTRLKYLNIMRDLREAAGLGSPTIFTTNPRESLNAILKKKVDYKQHECQ